MNGLGAVKYLNNARHDKIIIHSTIIKIIKNDKYILL